MQDATARPGHVLRSVAGWMLVCAVLPAAPAWAQAQGSAAPIVYAASSSGLKPATLASKDLPVLPTPSVVPGVFNDRTTSQPAAPAAKASPANTGVLDIRPGALKSSYGPMPPTLARPSLPETSGFVSRPVATPAAASALAEPYAGAPYQVAGKWFVPMYEPNYDEVGLASWYGPDFHGKAAATGEIYDQMALTAAHPTLPIPSLARVTNLENGKSVVVRLNDRGPFVDDRLIDLSKGAALALDMTGKGTAKVRVQYVGPAPAAANSLPQAGPTPISFAQAAAPAPVPSKAQAAELAGAPSAPIERRAQSSTAAGIYLQAGAFADLANAYALRDKLSGAGPVSILEGQSGGQRLYRVMIGPWGAREDAERAQDRLANAGLKSILVSR